MTPIITAPGAFRDISNADYHHNPAICPGPSISSTGLKYFVALEQQKKGKTPRHYIEGKAKPPVQTDALRIGAAFHDALLLPDEYAERYHVTPEGFSRAKSKAMAEEIAIADAAADDGKTVLSFDEAEQIAALVDALRGHPTIAALFKHGEAETTFAWQDAETGVWVRARPDWMLKTRAFGINIKSAADASYDGFRRDMHTFGYHQSAALELDGYHAIYGARPGNYLFPTVEKPGKGWEPGDYLPVALWELPSEDIERGRWLNRQALRMFADCLSSGKYPGYADEPALCHLPGYARKAIDDLSTAEGVAWSAAA